MSITILLADDHLIFRQGLKSLLERHSDMLVIGEAPDGRTAVALARELKPDVVVMDIGMPELNGIDATRQLTADANGPKVIALSMHSDRRFASEMLKAGAKGYLVKDGAFEELATAIRAVMAGKTFLSPQLVNVALDDTTRRAPGTEPVVFTKLSPREREVLQLMAEGRATKEIAMDLHVSVKTVETHRRQLMDKLDMHSVAELTKYAIREGLTTVEK